ncbi:MAG TPA: amidase [Dehalococcoidia bacterium]|nr:amidase [Dehalococcoidia bacterium]
MSLIEMADAIKSKRLSPVEIMDAALYRIEELNPKVNAYCTLVAESARKQAIEAETAVIRGEELGPLHGVPVSIKDLIFTKDIRTTGGSKIYENSIPQQDAIVVERLKAAGAIVIGKTNTSEFGWAAITHNPLFGATHNPWNPELAAGGSSGGAAASIALSMGSLAIGSDAAGSIRIPSSFCGVFGFKPSFGRVPQYPNFPGWETLSHIGPITRTVQDAALAMEVIAGRDDRDRFSLPDTGLRYLPFLNGDLKGLRIAWSQDIGYAIVDPQVLKVTEAAVKTFALLGSTIEAARPEFRSPEKAYSSYIGIRLGVVLQDKMEEWGDRIDARLARFVEQNRNKSATEYIRACFELLEYWGEIRPFFEKYDLLLTPTVAVPPFELNSYGPREIAGSKVSPLGWMPFTYPFNITGQPAASVPCGWTDDGLPIGLQIVGRRFDDVTVLRAAAAFEQALPWADRRPPL